MNDFVLHIEAEFNPQEADPVYSRITDAYLAWKPARAARITLGKQSAGFTLDGLTSSKNLLTIDRNNLTQNIWFTEEYIPGISVGGDIEGVIYFAGVFSSGDKTSEFGDFAAGEFALLRLAHDFSKAIGAQQALLRISYVDNHPDPENGFTKKLYRIFSLNLEFEGETWGIRGDISSGQGYDDQSDLSGFVVMPFYKLSEAFELVGRYTFVESEEDNGVRFARYERFIADGSGNRYEEFYLGLNYYWYGDKLKLQNAIQYVEMFDRANDGGAYSGFSWTTGFRISW